ncbi:hypothetical protein LS73_004225 [Helicobacter muridarum]|uniref:Outer membrane protein n=1 Tax=Helicobacter muridarum TaxID=216 RepID=A0A099U046_9HELI|nr:hypothetical protein [Helicobacter muridarum]TLE00622.1 hypothetical protein LS73_004225 [Helicobacter muridarum]STQ85639.1 outer membrane protein [Helicobacter muridarum]
MRKISYFTKICASGIVATALVAGSLGSSASALPLIGIEAGGIVSADFSDAKHYNFDKSSLSFGGYARIWLKTKIRIAPFVKFESVSSGSLLKNRYNNIQYGAVVGYSIFGILTPYVGGSRSTFNNNLTDTWALNYGLHFTLPLVPLAIGLDGSYQKPKLDGYNMNIHRIGLTLALQF